MRSRKAIRISIVFLIQLAFYLLVSSYLHALELSGFIAAESRLFLNEPLLQVQEKNNSSIVLQPEFYHERENGSSFTFVPFARLDSADSERTHIDVREFNYLWLQDTWEMRIGIGKVFWGATEFVHLVDIINQTDFVEAIDGEDKLGQPMVQIAISRDWGYMDFFVLPWFRERTYAGEDGRLRSGLIVDTDNVLYENADEEHHIDFAVRYSGTYNDMDFGLYHFRGTGREPLLLPTLNGLGVPVLIPNYVQISQTGTDMQLAAGNWLWKLEGLHRRGQGESFFSVAGGFEYTFFSVLESSYDIGLIGESIYDDRQDNATTFFENDIMLGLRIAANDAAGSELLAGLIQDLDSSARSLSIEASRRLGNDWKVILDAYFFFSVPEDDVLYSLRDDDYLSLQLSYYF